MNIPLRMGYKQTEVGVIPEDWDVIPIGQAGEVLGGRQRSPHAIGEPTKYLRVANVFDGFIAIDDVREMPFTQPERQRFSLRSGDILLNEGQSLELVGRSATYRGEPHNCCFQNTLVRFRAFPGTDTSFAQTVFQSYLRRGIFAAIALQTTSIAHLGAGRFAALKIPRPPLPEQRAIAEALNDADALLESLEQLVVKKRRIKQGTMQELLTGKSHLPGFSADWEVMRLGDIAEMGSGGTPPSSVSEYYDGDIPWVSISDMTKGGKVIASTERNLSREGFTHSAAQMFPAGTVLYAMYASLGECSIAGTPLCTSQAILGIRPKERLNVEFLYYYLTSLKSSVKFMGQQGTQSNLNKGMVEAFQIELPPISEQIVIAATISDMDAEIADLEAQLTKAQDIKQGMMDKLLTGKIRLR